MTLRIVAHRWNRLLPTLIAALAASSSASAVETWKRWEKVLFASGSYSNPYLEHELSVTYTGPDGAVYQAGGFWEDDDEFRIRFMFPEPGVWTWETRFTNPSDAGLHGRSGTVVVQEYAGSNPFYERGALEVGPAGRHLLHDDGTPFRMVGDIAWLAYIRATDQEWLDYLDDRAARGFNVIVISVGATDRGSRNSEGFRPFPNDDAATWNDAFWRNVDDMIQAANDRGILIVACGISISSAFDTDAKRRAFARAFAARVAGNHVVLSPLQDWGSVDFADADDSALLAREAAPLNLVTQQLRRRPMPEHGLDFHEEDYLDFSGVQTNKGDPRDEDPTTQEEASRAQIEFVQDMHDAVPAKPVIVLEGIHENEVDQTGLRRRMLRRQAYLSFVGGASGFAASAFGIWTWGEGASFRPQWGAQSFEDALALPYNDYMMHLASFLDAVDTTSLEPFAEQDLVLNQASTFEHTMLMAARDDLGLAVAYLPDNEEIEIDMAAFPEPMSARWFRTTTGTFVVQPDPVPNDGARVLMKPSSWSDAVLVLEAMPEPHAASGLVAGAMLTSLLVRRRASRHGFPGA